jgi:hypothetical protein
MINGQDLALQRAAAVALDRLSEAAPLQVMTYLNANPATMADRPFVRADYFAKANLSQPSELQAVEVYLGRADVSVAEKVKLFKGLITPATFVSENLLTPPTPEPSEDDAARLAGIAKTTRRWIETNRFPELQSELQRLQSRLPAQP